MNGDRLRRGLPRRPLLLGVPLLAVGARSRAQPAAVQEGVFDPAGRRLDRSNLRPSFIEDFDSFSHSDGAAGRWRTNLGYGGPRSIDSHTFTSSRQRQIFVSQQTLGATGNEPLGLDPFRLRGGVLSIEARRMPPQAAARLWNYDFVSGVITTRFSFSQTYGYFEARMRMPAGRGFWPAFWLLRRDGRWPPEIDIVEMLGHDPRRIYLSWHAQEGGRRRSLTRPIRVPDTTTGFHSYGFMWRPETMAWYFDEVEIWRQPTLPDWHEPAYIILNLGVGGDWPGNPDATTPFPSSMDVDFVRAWRFAA